MSSTVVCVQVRSGRPTRVFEQKVSAMYFLEEVVDHLLL